MSTSEYWRTGIYSQESAPGIIIAHGKSCDSHVTYCHVILCVCIGVTGQYLTDTNTNLFISRDGGSTWSMVSTINNIIIIIISLLSSHRLLLVHGVLGY